VDFTESSTIARAFSSVAMVRNVGEGAGNAEGPSECLGNHALSGGGPNGVDADVVQPLVGTSRSRVRTRLTFWKSPADQPDSARPLLLLISAMAALSYAWGMSNFPLESFYAAAARSMGSSWRDFFFGAVDPSGR